MKQNSLFNLKPKAKTDIAVSTDFAELEVKIASGIYIPKEGDEVILLNVNDGIEAVVEYVDKKNIFVDYFYPVQCRVPKLNNMMVRSELKNVKRRNIV